MVACNACSGECENRKLCSACKQVVYCSRDCQLKDWSSHKRTCRPAAQLVWQRPGTYHHLFRKVRLHPSPTLEHELGKLRAPPKDWWVCWCRDGVDERDGTVDLVHRPAGNEVLALLPISRRHLSSCAGSSHATRIISSPFPFRSMQCRVVLDVHGPGTVVGEDTSYPAISVSVQSGEVPSPALDFIRAPSKESCALAHSSCDTPGCEQVSLFAGNAMCIDGKFRLRPLSWTGGRAGLVGLGDLHSCGEVRLDHVTVLPLPTASRAIARLAGWDLPFGPSAEISSSDDEGEGASDRAEQGASEAVACDGEGGAAASTSGGLSEGVRDSIASAAAVAAAAVGVEDVDVSKPPSPHAPSSEPSKSAKKSSRKRGKKEGGGEERMYVQVEGSPRVLSPREAEEAAQVAHYLDTAGEKPLRGIGLPVRVVKGGADVECGDNAVASAVPTEGPPIGPTGGPFGNGDANEVALIGVIVRGLATGPAWSDVERMEATASVHTIHVHAMAPEKQAALEVPAHWRAFAATQAIYLPHPLVHKHVVVPASVYVDPHARIARETVVSDGAR